MLRRTFFSALLLLATEASMQAATLLNEIMLNPPGTDNYEFVEILTDANTTITDLWLLQIEGDSTGAGTVDSAINLSGTMTGSNGLILLTSAGYPYTPASGTIVVQDSIFAGSTENGTITFLLVSGFTGTVATDYDSDNDGVFDSTPYSLLLDSVGWTDGGSTDKNYTTAVLSQSSGTPDGAFRIFGDSTANSTSSWIAGDLVDGGTPSVFDVPGDLLIDETKASSNITPGSGAALTPGSENFSGAAAPEPSRILLTLTALCATSFRRRRRS
ncbi:MAG: PEP-CTERM sorting domain-containing protein [Verrucomicrobiaceae bacterium]|nr:PEP-CTERM sorting domain-containing protein [Verrucomicrobiaceae bacterium]